MTPMKDEYIRLIAELDQVICHVRLFWLASKLPEDVAKWRSRIDELLDERLRIMRCRDAAPACVPA
jgi:hypothetical protein